MKITRNDITYNNAFGTTTNLSGIQRGKWYTLVLVCRTKYIVYASITDYSNYSQVLLPVGAGATIGNVDSKAKLYDGARLPVTVELTYNATLDAADDNMGICIDWATYQYIENDVGNNQIEKGKSGNTF